MARHLCRPRRGQVRGQGEAAVPYLHLKNISQAWLTRASARPPTRHTQQRRVLRRLLARAASDKLVRRVMMEQQVSRRCCVLSCFTVSMPKIVSSLPPTCRLNYNSPNRAKAWRRCEPAWERSLQRPLYPCPSVMPTLCRRASGLYFRSWFSRFWDVLYHRPSNVAITRPMHGLG